MVLLALGQAAQTSVDSVEHGHGPSRNRETIQYPVWRDSTGFEFLPAPRGMAGDYLISCGPLMWAISTVLIPAFAKPVLPMRVVTIELDALQSKRQSAGVHEQEVFHRIEVQRIRANSLDKGELCGFLDLPSFMEGARDAITTTQLLDSRARIMHAYSSDPRSDPLEVTPSDFVEVLKEKNIRLLNDMKAVKNENLALQEKLKGMEEKLRRERHKRSNRLLKAYNRLCKTKQDGDTNSVHAKCRDSIYTLETEIERHTLETEIERHTLETEIERLKASHETALLDARSKRLPDVNESKLGEAHTTQSNENTLCLSDDEKELVVKIG